MHLLVGFVLATISAAGQTPAENQAAPPTNQQSVTAQSAAVSSEKPIKPGGSVISPKLLYQPEIKLPRSARKQRLNGVVEVYLWVEPDGSVSHVAITKSLRPDLDALAMETVRKYKFEPATQSGKPVLVKLYVDVQIEVR